MTITNSDNARNLMFSARDMQPRANVETDLPPDPLVAAYDRDLGPLNRNALGDIESRLGAHAISRRGLTDRLFSFAEGTAFGFRIEEKSYDAKDPYVQACPIRRAIAEKMRVSGGGRKVSFVETAGLAELGGGYMATMGLRAAPFGGIGLNWGVTASSVMRYRTSTPKLLGFGENPAASFSSSKLEFPGNAKLAMAMPAGAEVEITGQGKTNANVAIPMSVGPSVAGLARGGIGLVVNNTASLAGEMSLSVLSLDKPGVVRVTLKKLDEESANTLVRIRAGLVFAVGTILNNVGGGMLRTYFEKLGAPNLEEFINLYTTLYASFTSREAHRGLTIGSWDLDLNDPKAQEAYENLLSLNTTVAEAMAHEHSPSVRDVHVAENEWEFAFGADIGMLGQKLIIFEALKREREGRLNGSDGKTLIYRNSIYTRRKKNILTGSKEIHWETVSLKKGEEGESEPFLRIKFDQKNWDFGKDSVDRMMRFADAMMIPRHQIEGGEEDKLKKASDKLIRLAEVGLSTDVYFTKKGIENIDRADKDAARDAYLQVSATVRKRFKGLDLTSTDKTTLKAVSLIKEYLSYSGIENANKLAERLKVVPMLREEYQALMGRKLSEDAKLYKEAQDFGAVVERLTDTTSPEQVSSFFLSLGEQKGFDYMQTIAALSKLAGAEEALVNTLSIAGGGVTIRNTSEGSLLGPREIVANELYRTVGEAN